MTGRTDADRRRAPTGPTGPDRILVVNAGSSSLKLRLLDGADTLVASRDLDAPGGRSDPAETEAALTALGDADAIGHRVVHGGERHDRAVRLDRDVIRELEGLVPLAPLHQPASLAAIDLVGRLRPGLPAVACFDTAFHATLPPAAATYALPAAWRERWGLRRFGFHGLSHAWASRRAAALIGRPVEDLRIVTCHLGAGASLAAVAGGRSVDTTMGFTPLEGLVMATRSGTVDPGLLLWLQEQAGLSAAEIGDALEHRSGLAGLAGIAGGDLRAVLEAADAGDAAAVLAVEVAIHRLRAGIASMTAALGGLDVLVFTGGVGEHAAVVRARAVGGLAFLGLRIDGAANDAATDGVDREIGARGAPARILVVAAREDLQIAREVRAVLTAPG